MPVAKPPTDAELAAHPVVSHEEWLDARRELLRKEKELTRLNDELSALRRRLPWEKVEKDYHFHTEQGVKSLADLFDGRSQLIVYHFMFGPDWKEGCDGCSFLSDHFDGPNLHLPHHDVSLVVVSRAPLEKLLEFKRRMSWKFPWVSSEGTDFNFDFHASSKAGQRYLYNFEEEEGGDRDEEHHGMSVFYRQADGGIVRTYACHARGVDPLCGAHQLLDLTPKGRNENGTMDWVRLHDRYVKEDGHKGCCGC